MSDETAVLLARIDARLDAQDKSLAYLVANLDGAIAEGQRQGQKLAMLEGHCAERERHVSEALQRLGVKAHELEDTGVHNLLELQRRAASASTLRAVVKYVVVALGAAGTACAIYSTIAKPRANNQPAPARVVDAGRR